MIDKERLRILAEAASVHHAEALLMEARTRTTSKRRFVCWKDKCPICNLIRAVKELEER